jgi:transketolase
MDIGRRMGLEYGPPTRNAFSEALRAISGTDPKLVVVDGGVGNSARTNYFRDQYPDRFFNVGIAESNLVGIASGLAASGKDVLAANFACFLLCNAYEALDQTVQTVHDPDRRSP